MQTIWTYLGQKNKLKPDENVWKNHAYCDAKMLWQINRISKNIQEQKSTKTLLFIYSDLEPLLEKINKSENNPGKSFTTKVKNRVACGYLIFTHCSFNATKSKHDITTEVKTTWKGL